MCSFCALVFLFNKKPQKTATKVKKLSNKTYPVIPKNSVKS